MGLLRQGCGILALLASASLLCASGADSHPSLCSQKTVRLGLAVADGCWKPLAHGWRSPTPVRIDGLKLNGAGTITLDTRARTITSSRPVHWQIGNVTIRNAVFRWRPGSLPAFAASGTIGGLALGGNAKLTFSGRDGGSATVSAQATVPELAGESVSGAITLRATRNRPFNLEAVHIKVAALALDRLVFQALDFSYSHNTWSAEASVRLPSFAIPTRTLTGSIEISAGAVRDIGIEGSSLDIPLGEGLTLTKAGLSLRFAPVVIQGTATAVYGPPIGSSGPLEVDGSMQYSSSEHRWDATGRVTLPWSLPGVHPSIAAGLELQPGHDMSFTGDLDLTVHHFGLKGHLDGFASANAFNIEGDSTLDLTPLRLSGNALISSRGMGACGRTQLRAFGFGVGVGPRIGFSYGWGGNLNIISSSCDVGELEVRPPNSIFGTLAAPTFNETSPAQFAVFAATGGDFQVSGPTGTFATDPTDTPDPNTENSFVVRDQDTNTTYLGIPVPAPGSVDDLYTLTPMPGVTLTAVAAAPGLKEHDPSIAPTGITAGVAPNAGQQQLTYTIPADELAPGETVSFYQGISPDLAGAEPIVQDVTTSGIASFTPEPIGPSSRFVFGVVSIDGSPREQFQVAGFTAASLPLPTASIGIQAAATGWTISFLKVPRPVAIWELLTTTDDGRTTYQEVPGADKTAPIDALGAKSATIQVTPVDAYGREGTTYRCDSQKPGICPQG